MNYAYAKVRSLASFTPNSVTPEFYYIYSSRLIPRNAQKYPYQIKAVHTCESVNAP
jgi:hypothetical protein